MKKRSGIAAALVIFIIAFIAAGFFMIIMDQVFQKASTWESTGPYSSGIYSSYVLSFFQDVWDWFAVIILIVLGIWLYLRSEESAVGID